MKSSTKLLWAWLSVSVALLILGLLTEPHGADFETTYKLAHIALLVFGWTLVRTEEDR